MSRGTERSDVFTPDAISKKMASYLLPNGSLLEPSVGTGQLLSHINVKKYKIDVYDINQEYLEKCAETYHLPKKSIHCQDFLTSKSQKYQNIILNPPFIRFQDLSVDYRAFIKKEWPVLSKGNIDLYYAFLVKCLDCLSDDGVMVAITPNSYLYNKSALSFRQYLIANRFVKEIIDYQSQKVFPGVSTYCCITIFTKTPNENFIYNDTVRSYDGVNDSFLSSPDDNDDKTTLGDICRIRNGIATLRDKIYIHTEKLFNEPCWKPLTTPSQSLHWVIYPYENGVIIKEEQFKRDNPQTYKYLLTCKEELAKRDKGAKEYPTWYAYGRTQSLMISDAENVLYLPTFFDPSTIPCWKAPPTLFSGCLCIDNISDTDVSLDRIQQIIIEHRDYISENSSKRGGGWINLTSTTLKTIKC